MNWTSLSYNLQNYRLLFACRRAKQTLTDQEEEYWSRVQDCSRMSGKEKGHAEEQGDVGVGLILGLCVLVGVLSPAEAVIKIEKAEVQNGVAFIKGNGANLGAQITWEGAVVTTANTKNGGFSFFGVLPDDCQGELTDGVETVQVNVLNCTFRAPAAVERTGQTMSFAAGDDGDIKAGVPFPSPRFTDNGDGTVTDHLTGLIWLKNAYCFVG
jgi:hypothetical protein